MQKTVLMIAVVALVGCGTTSWVSDPTDPSNVKIEMQIRYNGINKPTGELTKADLEKVTELNLIGTELTSVKGLEKLTQLETLYLQNNELTDVKGLEKLTQLKELTLPLNKLTDLTGLEKLTQLTLLILENNPGLTKAQIDQLKRALPKCTILSGRPK